MRDGIAPTAAPPVCAVNAALPRLLPHSRVSILRDSPHRSKQHVPISSLDTPLLYRLGARTRRRYVWLRRTAPPSTHRLDAASLSLLVQARVTLDTGPSPHEAAQSLRARWPPPFATSYGLVSDSVRVASPNGPFGRRSRSLPGHGQMTRQSPRHVDLGVRCHPAVIRPGRQTVSVFAHPVSCRLTPLCVIRRIQRSTCYSTRPPSDDLLVTYSTCFRLQPPRSLYRRSGRQEGFPPRRTALPADFDLEPILELASIHTASLYLR